MEPAIGVLFEQFSDFDSSSSAIASKQVFTYYI